MWENEGYIGRETYNRYSKYIQNAQRTEHYTRRMGESRSVGSRYPVLTALFYSR